MRTTDLEEIRAVVQRVRAERYPHVPEEFIDMVLNAEATSADEQAAMTLIRKIAQGTGEG